MGSICAELRWQLRLFLKTEYVVNISTALVDEFVKRVTVLPAPPLSLGGPAMNFVDPESIHMPQIAWIL